MHDSNVNTLRHCWLGASLGYVVGPDSTRGRIATNHRLDAVFRKVTRVSQREWASKSQFIH